tara:strand:+ start:830 stop:1246 length:417 start_codon:yes stop_codon:yes gene_type:complete
MRTTWTLNDIGCVLSVFALAAFLPLAIVGRHLFQSNADTTISHAVAGWACLTIYGLAALFNFYLSLIRPWLHTRRDEGEYKHVSGIPIVHSLFLLAARVTLPPNVLAGILMLLLLGLDTGAAHWAAFAVASEFLPKRG